MTMVEAAATKENTLNKAASCWQLLKLEQKCDYLLNSELWSDCSFMVGSEPNKMKVKAHKLILTMSSPVFDKMFYEEQSENNEWLISNVQPEAFQAMLKYIYTGVIDIDSFDMAWKLWHGGKNYELPHLVEECNSYICSAVSPGNVCQSYEFAHFFDEKTIMDKCVEIISTKTKEVLNDSSFVDIELDTLLTVLSLDHLNVDSEADLIAAVVRYAEAEKKRQGQISPADNEALSEKLSELKLEPELSGEKVLLNGESSPQRSPAPKADSETPAEVIISEPTTAEKVPDHPMPPGLRAAIEKLRFLSLTPKQFAKLHPLSILTRDEALAIMLNISASGSVPMPNGFSDSRERRLRIDVVDEPPNSVAATEFQTPAEIVEGLTSRDLSQMKAAALAACEMLSKDTETPNTRSELVEAGVVPRLVAALDQLCPDLQLDAACSLAYIASGTQEHTLAVVDGGAIPKLIALLEDGGEVAAQAAASLGAIAEKGPGNRDAVLNLGALTAMLPYMTRSTPVEQLRTYVWAYSNMCWHYEPIVSFELVSPGLPHISALLVLTDQEVLANACLALSSLTDGPNERIEYIQAIPKLTERLIALLGHSAPQVQTPALRALGNMLTGTEEQVDRCLKAGCLNHIINFLKCEDASRVKEAAWAASSILSGTPEQIQKALDKQIQEPLIKLLSEGAGKGQEEAVWAITNLYRGCTARQVEWLMRTGFLEPYCSFLSSPEHPAVPIILHGLNELLKEVNILVNIRILEKLQEIGVPELLKTLKEHADEKIRQEAAILMLMISAHNTAAKNQLPPKPIEMINGDISSPSIFSLASYVPDVGGRRVRKAVRVGSGYRVRNP